MKVLFYFILIHSVLWSSGSLEETLKFNSHFYSFKMITKEDISTLYLSLPNGGVMHINLRGNHLVPKRLIRFKGIDDGGLEEGVELVIALKAYKLKNVSIAFSDDGTQESVNKTRSMLKIILEKWDSLSPENRRRLEFLRISKLSLSQVFLEHAGNALKPDGRFFYKRSPLGELGEISIDGKFSQGEKLQSGFTGFPHHETILQLKFLAPRTQENRTLLFTGDSFHKTAHDSFLSQISYLIEAQDKVSSRLWKNTISRVMGYYSPKKGFPAGISGTEYEIISSLYSLVNAPEKSRQSLIMKLERGEMEALRFHSKSIMAQALKKALDDMSSCYPLVNLWIESNHKEAVKALHFMN